MSLLSTTSTSTYKGHIISVMESAFGQTFFVVDTNLTSAYWSISEAKRAINGKALNYEPVDISAL